VRNLTRCLIAAGLISLSGCALVSVPAVLVTSPSTGVPYRSTRALLASPNPYASEWIDGLGALALLDAPILAISETAILPLTLLVRGLWGERLPLPGPYSDLGLLERSDLEEELVRVCELGELCKVETVAAEVRDGLATQSYRLVGTRRSARVLLAQVPWWSSSDSLSLTSRGGWAVAYWNLAGRQDLFAR
jgi:uncharacterized protein YceK